MSQGTYDFGLIGLGVMGENFILNVIDNGFSAIGYDLRTEKIPEFEAKGIHAVSNLEAFVSGLKRPRKVMLLVPAGKPVDDSIENLIPLLEEGDIIIDGGNAFFKNTDKREAYLKEKGINFFGMGVSGGSKGARRGPSLMPGGNKEAYEDMKDILEAVSAKVNGEACVTHLGNTSAGNYVKMVHNGIEYGMMQLIAEAYDFLKRGAGLNNQEIYQAFKNYNEGKLQSFLVEISRDIFAKEDELAEGMLVDKVLDKAKQKGTGKWTSQDAMNLGIPIPTIDAAVSMRALSALKSERVAADQAYALNDDIAVNTNKEAMVKLVGDALYVAFITTYAQGMHLLFEANKEYNYELDLASVAKIWRGGCIIRASLLEDIRQAYKATPQLKNLLQSNIFQKEVVNNYAAFKELMQLTAQKGLASLCFSASYNYLNAFITDRLPLNLVQAQRDYFGSHTFERIDKEGTFHVEWV